MSPSKDVARQHSDISGNVIFEDCRILFRNFAGKEGQYNREGDRNFVLVLGTRDAEQMLSDGWNIKYLKKREEDDEPLPYVQVAVSYKNRPPRIVLVTSKNKTEVPEQLLPMLDWVEIASVDLIINPYSWSVNGKSGIKAYLKSIFITIEEDRLEKKYADVPEINMIPDSGQSAFMEPKELTNGEDDDIYVEWEDIPDAPASIPF